MWVVERIVQIGQRLYEELLIYTVARQAVPQTEARVFSLLPDEEYELASGHPEGQTGVMGVCRLEKSGYPCVGDHIGLLRAPLPNRTAVLARRKR